MGLRSGKDEDAHGNWTVNLRTIGRQGGASKEWRADENALLELRESSDENEAPGIPNNGSANLVLWLPNKANVSNIWKEDGNNIDQRWGWCDEQWV